MRHFQSKIFSYTIFIEDELCFEWSGVSDIHKRLWKGMGRYKICKSEISFTEIFPVEINERFIDGYHWCLDDIHDKRWCVLWEQSSCTSSWAR